jgi:hypothetical protein
MLHHRLQYHQLHMAKPGATMLHAVLSSNVRGDQIPSDWKVDGFSSRQRYEGNLR